MNSEIAVGRLLAPYYGTSTTIWALLIAAVLGSLAAGNLLGGRLSRSREPRGWLELGLIGSAVLIALMPWLGRWLLEGSLERLRNGQLFALFGALLAVTGLLTLPLVQLGAMGPLLLHTAGGQRSDQRLGQELGGLAGELGAASTLGSLVGTLGSGLLLIPWLGTTRTLCSGSAVLLLSALSLKRRSTANVSLVAALLAAVILSAAAAHGAPRGCHSGRLLWQGESRYQHLTVVETGSERQLRVNDGFAVQSYAPLDGSLPARGVWGYYALAPTFGRVPTPRNVLLLGLGGGTTAQLYARLYPDARLTGVELDEQMVRAGQRWLGFDPATLELVIADARSFVDRQAARRRGSYDVIILDAFQFPYVPFQLTTLEFFTQLEALLSEGGVLMVNVGRFDEHRDVVDALGATLRHVLPHLVAADVNPRSNTLLVATRHPPALALGAKGLTVGEETRRYLEGSQHLLAGFRGMGERLAAPPLTDDHAPVEWLTDRVLYRALLGALRRGDGL